MIFSSVSPKKLRDVGLHADDREKEYSVRLNFGDSQWFRLTLQTEMTKNEVVGLLAELIQHLTDEERTEA